MGKSKRVLLEDIDALTFYKNQMTSTAGSNRWGSKAIPQLSCIGGDACGEYAPEIVQVCSDILLPVAMYRIIDQCHNKGSDGVDIQWACFSEMPSNYRLGQTTVSCEGYSYRDDPYVLAGSCGLEYTLHKVGTFGSSSLGPESISPFGWIVLALVAFMLYNSCCRRPAASMQNPPPRDPPPYEGLFGSASSFLHPKYYRTDNNLRNNITAGLAGAAAGYAAGRMASGGSGGSRQRTHSSSPVRRSDGASAASSSTHTSRGFGGTRRR